MKTRTNAPRGHDAYAPMPTQNRHYQTNAAKPADFRPEARAHETVQQMADQSPQAMKTAQLQTMADLGTANRTGMPDQLKTGIERLSGMAMDEVRVHYNSSQPAQLHAHAYAQGTEIHLAPGQERHLPHEAWHVVQQKQGRVKPTVQLHGGAQVNDDIELEKEADVMGMKALQLKPDETSHGMGCGCMACASISRGIVQQKPIGQEVIQRCDRCGDSSCIKGEKCRQPPNDMFGSGADEWGTKFYNQQQGHGGQPMEWEHPVPGKAYRDAGMGNSYRSAPVLQIPKAMHRGGVAGIGGGISSTGSSHSAQIWSGGMGQQLASGDWSDAIWKGVVDGLNAALATGHDLQKAAHAYWRIIMMHHERGDIDEQTAQLLLQQLMNTFASMSERPDLYGGPKKPGPGPGSSGGSGSGGSPVMVG